MKSAAFDPIKAGKGFQQRLREFKWIDDLSIWKLIIALELSQKFLTSWLIVPEHRK